MPMMDSQVDEVKSKVDIVGLISEYVQLKKAGRNYKSTCPFHNEKTPSFMVSPDRQIFKCFGCGEGGDAFEFVRRMDGVEFGEALKLLAGRVGVELKQYAPSPAEKRKETLLEISKLSCNLFHYVLAKHQLGKTALNYLRGRTITNKSIKDFQLGFAPRQRNFLFKFLVKKGFSPQDIIATGLALSTSDGPVDRFKGRVMFPICDIGGRVIAFSGRALGDNEPKYLNSPETPIFDKSKALYGINLAKSGIRKEKDAVLVEGNLDVISSHQVGVENTVAPLGTALTVQQVENLKKLTDSILFAFDTDLAGDAAAKRGIEIAESLGMNMKVVQLAENKDPDELIKKSPTMWKKAIKGAIPVYDYFISSAIKRFGASSAEGKRRVAGEILPILAKFTDEILRAHYLQELSLKLGVEEEDLRSSLEKYSSEDERTHDIKEVLDRPLTPKVSNIVEKYLLALIIQSNQLSSSVEKGLFSEDSFQEILKFIKDYRKEEKRWKIEAFAKKLPEALLPTFDELLFFNIDKEVLEFPEKVEKEMNYCAERLKELALRKNLKELSLEIKQAEAVGNNDKIRLLTERFRDMSKTLTSVEVK
jgi:DNA primase